MHYFAAYGEYNRDVSDREFFHIHLLKQLKTNDEFLKYLLGKSLRKLFFYHTMIEDLGIIVVKKSRLFFNKMLLAEFEKDHKVPVLYDFYYGKSGQTYEELFNSLGMRIAEIANKLSDDVLLKKLFYRDKLNFLPIDEDVASIAVGDLKIYSDLLFCVKNSDKYYFVSFDRENRDFIRFFHLYYGVNRMHLSPIAIKSVLINIDDAKLYEFDNCDVEVTENLRRIFECSNEIMEFDSSWHYREFDKCENIENCKCCRFKEICNI